ncbi:MAG TPA: tripartite tricarboxylate transporter substrate binding protein [Candidatus Methylomirabilis sp.]|nr:tripartite tricarboxylate transporter substrate binding protein [Candidatus Methylomirabilis sp.]
MRTHGRMLAICLLLAALIGPVPCAMGWEPSRPVEFVIPWAAGGGSDVVARTVAGVVEAEKLAPAPLVVVNKVGGNAMVALSYVYGKKGDPHTLMFAAWTNLMVPVMEKLPQGLKDFTPVARMVLDEQLLYVTWDSPFKSLKDLVAAAKKSPNNIRVAGVVIGSEDHVVDALFEAAAGIKLNYIVFKSGGDIMRELLGGHVETAWLNPSEAVAQQEAKKIRPLAVASQKRLPGMPDVPTFKEEGFDVVFDSHFRGMVGAPGMPAEAAAYYVGLMKRVTQTPRWQSYLKETMVTPAFMGGKEFGDYLQRQEELIRRTLTSLNLLK